MYDSNGRLASITFHTTNRKCGRFGGSNGPESAFNRFMHNLRKCFAGFHDSVYDSCVHSIGVYVQPIESLAEVRSGHYNYNGDNDSESESEKDEVIKSCVENLVPNLSESEGKNDCDVPAGFTTFSNALFDIDSLFDEFAGELTLLKSFPPGIDETDCHPEKEIRFAKRLLYDNSSPRPPEEIVSDISNADIESFSPSPIPNEDRTLNIKMLGDVSDQKVPIPNLTITRILNQEKSPDLFSHLGFEAFQPSAECPMIINGKNLPLSDVLLFHL
nr:hypothetical protein [Tanacetum cinerariifolium]